MYVSEYVRAYVCARHEALRVSRGKKLPILALTATAHKTTVLCALQVIVHEVPGQEIEVEVFDKDPDKDDFLGR